MPLACVGNEITSCREKWEGYLDELDEEFYNCYGECDATIERKTHSNLIVSGPMVDVHIKELGSMMLVKLSKRRLTGIQQSSTILIPSEVYINIIKLIKGYGDWLFKCIFFLFLFPASTRVKTKLTNSLIDHNIKTLHITYFLTQTVYIEVVKIISSSIHSREYKNITYFFSTS